MISTTLNCIVIAMSTLHSRIGTAREQKGLNQSELARALGVSPQAVQGWEAGKSSPRGSRLAALANCLGVSVAWLMVGGDSPAASIEPNVEPGPPITSVARRIEIVGTAQLGPEGFWFELDGGDGHVETWSRDEDAYALRLKGDSMAPAIRSGWVAVCEPNHRLVPGEYVMVTTRDGQSMVKELLFENDDGVSLMSVNSAYGDRLFVNWQDVQAIHYVGNILAPSKILGRL